MAGDGEGVRVGDDVGQVALEVGDGALAAGRRVLLRVALLLDKITIVAEYNGVCLWLRMGRARNPKPGSILGTETRA